MKDEKKKRDSGKFYTIVKADGKEIKRVKKSEKELTEEDVNYFYRLIADAYNSAPLAAQLIFMGNATPAYIQAVESLSRGFTEEESTTPMGGPTVEA